MEDTSSAEATGTNEQFATPEVWANMTPEQRAKASKIRSAIAEGPLKGFNITEERLRVVQVEQRFIIIDTGGGVGIGGLSADQASYEAVMASDNNALFQVEVDGVTYDTRSGMTGKVYRAKVEDARLRGVALPDSEQYAQETGDIWTQTMFTGEGLSGSGLLACGYVDGGSYELTWADPTEEYPVLRVCPAVEVQ